MSRAGRTSWKEIESSRIEILSLAEGFFQSSVLFALLKLDLFELIGETEKNLDQLAQTLGARPETLARLLNAGVVLGLLATNDGVAYTLTPASRDMLLSSAGENYLGNWIRNLDFFRTALATLDEAVSTSAPTVDPETHVGAAAATTREFTLAMHEYAVSRGRELADFLDTSNCTSLLDLGCGPGTYAFELGLRNPQLKLFLLDTPEVLEVAAEIQSSYQLDNQVEYLPLDGLQDEIPGSYDLVLLSNTLHMIGHAGSQELLQRLHGCINPGGSVVIQANFLRDDHLGERWPVFVDLVQLCTTTNGQNHSVGETRSWLEAAGFVDIEYNPMTLFNNNSFLRAYRR